MSTSCDATGLRLTSATYFDDYPEPKRKQKKIEPASRNDLKVFSRMLRAGKCRAVAECYKDLRGNLISKKSFGHIHHPAHLFGTLAKSEWDRLIARRTISAVYGTVVVHEWLRFRLEKELFQTDDSSACLTEDISTCDSLLQVSDGSESCDSWVLP